MSFFFLRFRFFCFIQKKFLFWLQVFFFIFFMSYIQLRPYFSFSWGAKTTFIFQFFNWFMTNEKHWIFKERKNQNGYAERVDFVFYTNIFHKYFFNSVFCSDAHMSSMTKHSYELFQNFVFLFIVIFF